VRRERGQREDGERDALGLVVAEVQGIEGSSGELDPEKEQRGGIIGE
jgi:hypothetical protein